MVGYKTKLTQKEIVEVAEIAMGMATNKKHPMWNASKKGELEYENKLTDISKSYIWGLGLPEFLEFDYCMSHWNGDKRDDLINMIQRITYLQDTIKTNEGNFVCIKNLNGEVTHSFLTGEYHFQNEKNENTDGVNKVFKIETIRDGEKAKDTPINPDLISHKNQLIKSRLEDLTQTGWKRVECGEINGRTEETIIAIGEEAVISALRSNITNKKDREFSQMARDSIKKRPQQKTDYSVPTIFDPFQVMQTLLRN